MKTQLTNMPPDDIKLSGERLVQIANKQLRTDFDNNGTYVRWTLHRGPFVLKSTNFIKNKAKITEGDIISNNVYYYVIYTKLTAGDPKYDKYSLFKNGHFGLYGYIVFGQNKINPDDVSVIEYCLSKNDNPNINLFSTEEDIYYAFPSQLFVESQNTYKGYNMDSDETVLDIDVLPVNVADNLFTENDKYRAVRTIPINYTSKLPDYLDIMTFRIHNHEVDGHPTLFTEQDYEFYYNYTYYDENGKLKRAENLTYSLTRDGGLSFGGNQADFINFRFIQNGCGIIGIANATHYLNQRKGAHLYDIPQVEVETYNACKMVYELAEYIAKLRLSRIGDFSESISQVTIDTYDHCENNNLANGWIIKNGGLTLPDIIEAINESKIINSYNPYYSNAFAIINPENIKWKSLSADKLTDNKLIPLLGNKILVNNQELNLDKTIEAVRNYLNKGIPVLAYAASPNYDIYLFKSFTKHITMIHKIYKTGKTHPNIIEVSNYGHPVGYNFDLWWGTEGKSDKVLIGVELLNVNEPEVK